MKPNLKIEIHQEQDEGSSTWRYKIQLIYRHDRFNIHFISPEWFTKVEADARVIRMVADLDAETDGIIIANNKQGEYED